MYPTSAAPEGTSVACGQTLSALVVQEQDPDPAWFLRILGEAPLPHGVRRDHEPGDPAVTLCTFIADLTAGEAVIANRDEQPVTIPLRDLAEGHPPRQHAGGPSGHPGRPRRSSPLILSLTRRGSPRWSGTSSPWPSRRHGVECGRDATPTGGR
jgi:hypothetical protein